MAHKIILIGAGQLGSRHLQGLARSQRELDIDVVDPAPASLDVAVARFAEVAEASSNVTATFLNEIPTGRDYEAAIIATSSGPRAAVARELLSRCGVGALVFEKVLFTRLEDYDSVGELLAGKSVPAWVNCPRRMYPLYKELRPVLGGPVRVAQQGGMWGLGCNAVHFADLAAFLSGEERFTWDASGLDCAVHDSSRKGYIEFSGTLTAEAPGGAQLALHARAGSVAPPVLNILGQRATAVIDEIHGSGTICREDNGWKPEPLEVRLPYQSELSHLFLEDILARGACELPGFKGSALLHTGMIQALLGHLRRCGRSVESCPIT